ncbi:MAG: peptidoglycan recognition family protein [Thermomicrobiales bacterium]
MASRDRSSLDTPNNSEPYAMIRSIYYYHAVTRGWGDIGYNFLVDHRGNVYEGRYGGENAIGIHSGTFNTGSCGICCMGNFQNVDITSSAQAALISIVAWSIRNYDPNEEKYFFGNLLPTIMGHRNISRTTCPGDELYADLPYIRNAVADTLGTGQYNGGSSDLRTGQSADHDRSRQRPIRPWHELLRRENAQFRSDGHDRRRTCRRIWLQLVRRENLRRQRLDGNDQLLHHDIGWLQASGRIQGRQHRSNHRLIVVEDRSRHRLSGDHGHAGRDQTHDYLRLQIGRTATTGTR